MRHILRGFTMWLDSAEYGQELEELQLPTLTEVTQEYRGGGMDLGVAVPMAAIEPLEVTFKFAGPNPEMLRNTLLGPGGRKRTTFRGATVDEADGKTNTNIILVDGQFSEKTPDNWQRGEKAGVEWGIRGIVYYKWTVNNETLIEVQAWPPKRVIAGFDRLRPINEALGF